MGGSYRYGRSSSPLFLPFGSLLFLPFGRSWERPVNAQSVCLDYEGSHRIDPIHRAPDSSAACLPHPTQFASLLSFPALSSIELTCQLLFISLPQEVPTASAIIPLGEVALTGVPGTLASSDHLRLAVSPTMSMCQTLSNYICWCCFVQRQTRDQTVM